MRTIYIDSDYKCHVANDGTMTAVETSFFDGKCDTFIEGFCYDTSKGYAVACPWKSYSELEFAQLKYERQKLVDYESALSKIETALGV